MSILFKKIKHLNSIKISIYSNHIFYWKKIAMPQQTCPFCSIDKRLLIQETEHCFIIANLMQVATTDALLIISKRHIKNIIELNDEEYDDFCKTIRLVYQKLNNFWQNKFNILINEWLVANQTIPHLHCHVFSRKEKDGIKNMLRKNRKNIFSDRPETKTNKYLDKLKWYFSDWKLA